MAKGRTTPAEHIQEILDLALYRRQRGRFSIESQQGTILEEGEIAIENRQITSARTGQFVGQAALQAILSWRGVYVAFTPNDYPEPVHAAGSETPSPPALPTQESSFPVTPPDIPQFSDRRTAHDDANTIPLPEVGGLEAATPGVEWIIPCRLDQEQDVLLLPLTRPQRSTYLLIDGHRSVSDLARCTRKTMQEIESLVSELQKRGLITI